MTETTYINTRNTLESQDFINMSDREIAVRINFPDMCVVDSWYAVAVDTRLLCTVSLCAATRFDWFVAHHSWMTVRMMVDVMLGMMRRWWWWRARIGWW